jgi:hypothetical protein
MGSKRHEYEKGYHDGREAKPYDDGFRAGIALATLGLAGAPRENADDYKEGYKDGRDDRKP